MPGELAQVVASSGATYSGSFGHLTDRSVFVRGRIQVPFNEEVSLSLLGHTVAARVAFAPIHPPGLVLTFEARGEVLEAFSAWKPPSPMESWSDEDVTGTHDGQEAAMLASLMAKAEAAVSGSTPEVDSEDPTNTGVRDMENEATPLGTPAVYVEGRVMVPARDESPKPPSDSLDPTTRLRATTQVGTPIPETEVEPTTSPGGVEPIAVEASDPSPDGGER